MALVWSSLDGPVDQRIQVQASALGQVRMVLVELNSGTLLPPGDFPGQLLFWDGAAWVPVPNQGGPTARAEGLNNTNELDPCSLFLGDGAVSITGTTASMTSRLGNVIARVTDDTGGGEGEWQMSYSDGDRFTQIVGNPTLIQIIANQADGTIELLSFGVTQTMGSAWNVALGEGGFFVGLDEALGFNVQVPSTVEITLFNGRSQYQMQSDSHVFRNPDAGGTPQNNVQFGSSGDDPTAGFLGAAPVTRQSITGATTQDQVDSLVAALVAFGFVSDDR